MRHLPALQLPAVSPLPEATAHLDRIRGYVHRLERVGVLKQSPGASERTHYEVITRGVAVGQALLSPLDLRRLSRRDCVAGAAGDGGLRMGARTNQKPEEKH